MDVPMEGRRRAESWADVHRLIDRLRARGAVMFIARPQATAREGAEVLVRMRGIDRTVLSLTLRAQARRTGTFAVDVGVRFDGDERGDNRWEMMEYRGSSLRFADERLLVEDGEIDGGSDKKKGT